MAYLGEELPRRPCAHTKHVHKSHNYMDEDNYGNIVWLRCWGVEYVPKHRKETSHEPRR